MRSTCPSCGSEHCTAFYTAYGVPTNSCLLVSDRQQALDFPTGDIALSCCGTCGFIFNALWQPDRTVYSESYEETQGFSPTFNAFHKLLAEDLIARHGLHGKEVFEIGCGKGEFLTLICDLGNNRGVGYDPSFVPARQDGQGGKIRFVQELFTEATSEPAPDFVCCKMTLEHIGETQRFVQAVRRMASLERGTIVFFQIPDVRRVLAETAFWDVYYEHCSYFSPASLAYLFRLAGFDVLGTSTGYDDQYLMIEARVSEAGADVSSTAEEQGEIRELIRQTSEFAASAALISGYWRDWIRQSAASFRKIVVWGSGSKAVAFLSALGLRDEIEYVVDINPFRHGRFLPGTGQEIVAPAFLAKYQPDAIIVMNPIYCPEIRAELQRLGVDAEVYSVGSVDGAPESFEGSDETLIPAGTATQPQYQPSLL